MTQEEVEKVYEEIGPSIKMRVDLNTPERNKYEQKYNKYLLEKCEKNKLEVEFYQN